ncbi:MAG: T9SS type A sorting domain-containing protein [Flavobacteriales bacterium]|nr:T9SS type A sorting domain-containing protein [Flavobacteriales bacterium]
MERILLFPTILGISTLSFGQLPPQTQAPLKDHLIEVNAEWRSHATHLENADRSVSFTDETDRIAMHLRLVKEQLASRTAGELSADQAARRIASLEDLDRYADARRFPKNEVLPYRNPVFIDPYGTACAVGHLMIESGASDLAARIDDELELAYIRDMHLPEIGEWASVQGFTADELAWIQPAYAPPVPWFPLGPGLDGPVRVLLRLDNGDLLVAGDFNGPGGLELNSVAIWDGAAYNALGAGVHGYVNAAVEYNGNIVLGGAEMEGYSDLAIWDGSEWSFSSVFDGKYPLIHALHVHEGELYTAGAFSGFAGIDDVVMKRTDNGWEAVGEVFNNTVHALASHDGFLVAAGAFTGIDGPTDPVLDHVATLAGTSWSQLGNGLDAAVHALMEMDGALVAGGQLFENIVPTFGMARFNSGASDWEELIPGHEDHLSSNVGPAAIHALARRGSDIVFGGDFSFIDFGLLGMNTALWHAEDMGFEPLTGLMNGAVHALNVQGNTIVIGGDFNAGLPHIATTDLSTSINDHGSDALLTIVPNPAVDRISLSNGFGADAALRVIDMHGRMVHVPVERTAEVLRIDVRGLASGAYLVELEDQGRTVTGRFVKE